MPSLEIQSLNYHYDGHPVIQQLDLTVAENEIVCLLGASGCGKTTTLKAIAGLLHPQQGEIRINGKSVSSERHFVAPQHRNIGMMFQDYALFPHLTVAQNIAFGLTKLSKSEKQNRVAHMLGLVHLEGYAERFPHELSGGQQQRVAIARALAYHPNLLLLDEPFSNIDAQVRFQLIKDIRDIIKDQQVSAIFVSHSKDEAFAFADRLAIMHQGQIAQLGTPKELFQHPSSRQVAEFLGQGAYVAAQRHNGAQVETAFGSVESLIDIQSSARAGQIYLRPSHIELFNAEQGQVEVAQHRFVGTEYLYAIELEGQMLEVAMPSDKPLDLSRPVSLKIKPHAINFFS
ncbi:ABC transporter ATP-binding protein [Pseudoalteromonas sp. OOF1S-7]|uniref:ABC transporter ATP-binding protein n=1 Tax=Pseudoalteromonas sp. OOF1S-7 TaxID=2917757 RepID=UPI001EF55D8D|nr:ABC transporter ATP-binding protein [Pseudoalteromonas sp. OOF1S-7]MCG7535282.1 ABC transporter ATP-binding protein [Pseudoalteromonas sp. OOF1S-7]